jgi:hypothetical protein
VADSGSEKNSFAMLFDVCQHFFGDGSIFFFPFHFSLPTLFYAMSMKKIIKALDFFFHFEL